MITHALATPANTLASTRSPAVTSTGAPTPSSGTGANQTLGATDFLSLLTTELKNQDPLNPVDSTQSIAQLAQFSALQATTGLSTDFKKFESNFAVTQASGLLGQTVTVASADKSGNSPNTVGTVKSIQVVNGAPEFTLVNAAGAPYVDAGGNPVQFQTSQIIGITK